MNNAEVICDVDETTGIIAEEIEKNNKLNKSKSYMRGTPYWKSIDSEIKSVAKKYNCLVIEDACHALGAYYKTGKRNYKQLFCHYSIATTFSLRYKACCYG